MTNDQPRVNWPSRSAIVSSYKFVQAELDGLPYLRFQDDSKSDKTHAHILARFLQDSGISDYPLTRSGKPALKGERYKVVGMGEAKVDVEERRATFYGTSYDYGLTTDREHIESIRAIAPEWTLEVTGPTIIKI